MTTHIVSSGQVSSGVVLSAGDQETVLSGGIALATSLAGGNATLIVSAGGMASGTTIDATGGVVVVLGGTVSDTSFAGRGLIEIGTEIGTIVGAVGGTALNTTLGSGASMQLGTSATASGTRVGAFATLSNADGTLANTTVESGGLEYDVMGSGTFATAIDGGGEQFAAFGAVTTDTIIGSGGYEVVYAATAFGTHVLSGGALLLLPGASAVDSVVEAGGRVQSGGVIELYKQRVVSAFTGSASGQALTGVSAFVQSGGGLQNATVADTRLEVHAGGITMFATLLGGGDETVFSGGLARDTSVAWDTGGGRS